MLLTRFSAVLSPRAEPAKADWLRYRLGFFYDACYASVTRQRGADFGWLVLVDDRCPDDFREEVEELAKGAFSPVWTHEPFRRDSFAGPVADLTGRTAERTNEPGHAPYLITTRIDSDDAMAVDFMAAVQAQFERQERLFSTSPAACRSTGPARSIAATCCPTRSSRSSSAATPRTRRTRSMSPSTPACAPPARCARCARR